MNNALQTVKTEIEEEIHQTFFNQFSFLMSWMRIRGFREEFKTYSFFETAEEMFHQLESEKLWKSQGVLRDEKAGVWNINAFKATKMYGQYKDTGDCKICGKGPATILEETDQETGESVLSCPICYRDKATIGQELPKSNYVAFGKGFFAKDSDGKKIAIFSPKSNGYQKEKKSYYVKLLKDCEDTDEYYLIYHIGGNTEKQVPNNQNQPIRKYIANHVPLGPGERVLSFEEISHLSRWQKNGELYGSDLLGILKADIDNLGLIFSKGFENPGMTEARLDNIDRKTVSRFLTMSRMVNLFFSGWIKVVMSDDHKSDTITELSGVENIDKDRFAKYLSGKQINFHNIYTVYSAGDDLVLVGPWETMIIFSIFLNMQFRKFTCNNKFITLSAGLTFVKPKHPIASAIRQAEELLEKSKEAGKNRITFFGTTAEWHNLSPLINFFLFLDEKLNANNSRINSAFLYRLLEYHHMALRYFDEDNILGLKYLSAISYDIGRNIVEWDRDGKIKRGHEEREYLQPLVNQKPNKNALIYNIKMSLFWALYRNRKVRTDEHSSDI